MHSGEGRVTETRCSARCVSYWWLAGASVVALGTEALAQEMPAPPAAIPADVAPQPADEAAQPAAAADGTAVDTVTYLPADFARFSPRSALDMVRNIPDFQIAEVSSDRGLGQASGNILLNGQRLSGKSTDPETVLGSISASSVVRIEVTEGSRLNIPGLTGRVANVVYNAGQLSGQFRWQPEFRHNVSDIVTAGSLSLSGRLGASDLSISLSTIDGLRRGGFGREVVTDAMGTPIVRREEIVQLIGDYPRLTATLRRQWANGTILNLNLSGGHFAFDERVDGRAIDLPSGIAYTENFLRQEREWGGEFGGDVEFDLSGGRLKLIGLQRFEHSPIISRFLETPDGGQSSGTQFDRTIGEGESVVRAEYGWRSGTSDWQVALEGAYNFLDNRSALASIHGDGSRTPLLLDGANVFVDEWRGELSFSRSWPLTAGLTAQTSLGAEGSRIRQSGPDGQTRTFFRPKGSLALAWTVDADTTVNFTARRSVGQLSFFDFAASVDLNENNSSAGNRDLVPEQNWEIASEVTRRLGQIGSLTFGAYHDWITDIVDQVPLSATTEGVGNLPSARRWGVHASGTFQLDTLGLSGVRLDMSGRVNRTRVMDPVTFVPRPISDSQRYSFVFNLRQDVPNTQVAWGAELVAERSSPIYRLNQIAHNYLDRPRLTMYAEHKDVAGLTVRLSVRNLLYARESVERDAYVARRDGPISFRLRQSRDILPIVQLSISGSF